MYGPRTFPMGALYDESYKATDFNETRLIAIPLQACIYRTFSDVMSSAGVAIDAKYTQAAKDECQHIRIRWRALEARYEIPDWSQEDFDFSRGSVTVDIATRLAESTVHFVKQTDIGLSASQVLQLLHYRSTPERQWELETRSYLDDLINLSKDPATQERIDAMLKPWFLKRPLMVELTTEELLQVRKELEDVMKTTNTKNSIRQILKKYPMLGTPSKTRRMRSAR